MDGYEYGVQWVHDGYVHHTNMTLEDASKFIREAVEEGVRAGALQIIRRPRGDWEVYYPPPTPKMKSKRRSELTRDGWDC
jgi:hypothetical protein